MRQAEEIQDRKSRPSQNSVIHLSKSARQKLRDRRFDEAISLFRQGLDLEPDNPYLLSGMGDACRESGDFQEAEHCYLSLLDIDEKNLFALRGLGDVYKKQGRHLEAIDLWEKYLSYRPLDKHVMTRIADSLKLSQDYEKAEKVYQQILGKSPRDRFALTGLADLQHRQGRDEEAIQTYERVLSFDRNELHILTIVGKLCWRVSDFERAERYFRRALEVEPKNPYALYGLGNCYRWFREYEKALEIWQEILTFSEGTQALHTRMGDAHSNVGRVDEAEKSYLKALTYGEDIYSLAGLVCLYSERCNWPEARRFFVLLMSEAQDSGTRLDLLCKRFARFDQSVALIGLLRQLLSGDIEDQNLRRKLEQQLDALT